jgi:serine phosphatase RsbU (regulator of sigma subunit)
VARAAAPQESGRAGAAVRRSVTRGAQGLQIFEGAATLEPGSLILLYSDGVGRRGSMVRMMRRSRFERNSARLSAAGIVDAVFGRLSRRCAPALDDDLTLVAVRVAASNRRSREAVA